MAHADPQYRTAVVVPDQAMPPGGGLDRVLQPQVEDAGADHDLPGGPQEEVERGADVTPDVGDPQRAVAQFLQLGGALADLVLVTEPEPLVPDADGGQFFRGSAPTIGIVADAKLALASVSSARYNVLVNTAEIEDEEFTQEHRSRADREGDQEPCGVFQ